MPARPLWGQPGARMMEPTLDYRGPSSKPESPSASSPRSSICGGLSVAMFILTVFLFGYAWSTNSPESKHRDESATMAMATIGTAFVGLCLGIAGRARNERDRGLAVTGIVLNGAWLACGGIVLGIFLVIGYAIFGGSRGSDWH
jgi:hypothetical protein